MKTFIITTICAITLAPVASIASTIDFEDFNNGDLVSLVTSDDGLITASVSADERDSTGALTGIGNARAFDTNLAGTADPDLETDFFIDGTDTPDPTFRPGNVLIIQEADSSSIPDDSRFGGIIEFAFRQAVSFTGFTIVDDASLTVSALTDMGNVDLGSFSVTRDRGFNVFSFERVEGVLSLSFDFGTESGSIDSLVFDDPVTGEVPLPATLPLLLGALGGFGFMVGRRRKDV